MKLDFNFRESNQSFSLKFGEIQTASDGGFEKGYTQGYAKGEAEGYDKGQTDGIEQGQKAEYNRFWNSNQDNGNRRNYYYWYAYSWNDECLNPKYPIICEDGSTCGQNVFYNTVNLTRIPVDIVVNGISAKQMFYRCTHLRSIKKLVSNGVTDWTNTFASCTELEEIEIDGSIDVNFNIQPSAVLSVASAKNIIEHLTNYAGTANEYTYTINFNDAVWTALEAEGNTAPHGGTWRDYIETVVRWNT